MVPNLFSVKVTGFNSDFTEHLRMNISPSSQRDQNDAGVILVYLLLTLNLFHTLF